MTPTLTPRSRAIAIVCAAILAGALAYLMGTSIGTVMQSHGATDTTTTGDSVYVDTTATDPYVYYGDDQATLDAYADMDSATDRPDVGECDPYTLTDHEAAVATGITYAGLWDELMGLGWHGDPLDGMEALYAPECGAIQPQHHQP